MACEAVHTGTSFLTGTLTHFDCQARIIGAYGFGALADPASPVALALTGLLTVFIALFGFRLITGERLEGRDLVGGVIRIGLFLTLATSWPAWRTLGHDLVLDGPAQIASSIGIASGLPGSSNDLVARLQDADDGIVSLTMYGSGRLTGGVVAGSDTGDPVRGIAVPDQDAFGSGRTAFLVTVIGTYGLIHLGAGLLLALAPLMAGLVLFSGTMAVFTGWLRGLAFCALASIALSIVSSAMLGLVYPWLGDALAQRQTNAFTASAPTELLVLMLAFGVIMAGVLLLIAKVTFLPVLSVRLGGVQTEGADKDRRQSTLRSVPIQPSVPDRVALIARAVRGEAGQDRTSIIRPGSPASAGADRPQGSTATASGSSTTAITERLGTSYRRNSGRRTAAGDRRDRA